MRSSCLNYIKNFLHNVPKNDNKQRRRARASATSRRENFIKNLAQEKFIWKVLLFLFCRHRNGPQKEGSTTATNVNHNVWRCNFSAATRSRWGSVYGRLQFLRLEHVPSTKQINYDEFISLWTRRRLRCHCRPHDGDLNFLEINLIASVPEKFALT